MAHNRSIFLPHIQREKYISDKLELLKVGDFLIFLTRIMFLPLFYEATCDEFEAQAEPSRAEKLPSRVKPDNSIFELKPSCNFFDRYLFFPQNFTFSYKFLKYRVSHSKDE